MKNLLRIALLIGASSVAFAQNITLQKAPSTNILTTASNPLVIGNSQTLTIASGGTLTFASGATANFDPGTITWASVSKTGSSLADLATRSAADLSSGTLPDARFPATLPAVNGSALTNLSGAQIVAGTVADARIASALTGKTYNGVTLTGSSAPSLAITGTSTVSGTNTGDQTTVSGNAGTATALLNARTIGGSSFDGTANVTSFPIPGAIGSVTPSTGAFTTVNGITLTGSSTPSLAVTGTTAITGSNTGDQTISIIGDGTAAGSQGTLTLAVTKINGTALSGLATGILKNTTTTGVPSIAVAGTDYLTPTMPTTSVAFGSLTLALTPLAVTSGGSGLIAATLGGIRYGSATNTLSELSGNTSSTMSVLTQTGTGSASAAPVWTTTTGTGSVVRATSPVLVTPALGTPSSGVVTNLSGTASININGTVGATTPNTGTFTTLGVSNSVPSGYATTTLANSATTGYVSIALNAFASSVAKNANINWAPSLFLAFVSPDTTPITHSVNGSTITSTSSTGLDVTGTMTSSGTNRMSAYSTGTATFLSDGTITSVSDSRAKDTIGDFTKGLYEIRKLSPKLYHYNKASGLLTTDTLVSVYAQDLIKAGIPEAVATTRTVDVTESVAVDVNGSKRMETRAKKNAKGEKMTKQVSVDFYSVSDRVIISALVNAVKTLADQNDALAARVLAIEKK